MIVYGIPNCDTVKRARAQLDERGTAYTFHDFKKSGVLEKRLDTWLKAAGWEAPPHVPPATGHPGRRKGGLQRSKANPITRSLNNLVGPKQDRLRNCDAKVMRGFQVHSQA
jgi:glutaredoxin